MPLTNCLRFRVSTCSIAAKCSGAKVGIPSNCTFILGSHTVSPMEKIPGSNTPMISPAYASSMISRFSAIICWGCASLMRLPSCTCRYSVSFWNFPEQMRMNAMRSRWFLFIFA